MVAIGSEDQEISLHDLRVKSSLIQIIRGHAGVISNLKFCDDWLVATSVEDNRLAVWYDYLSKMHAKTSTLEAPAKDLAFSNGYLACCYNE